MNRLQKIRLQTGIVSYAFKLSRDPERTELVFEIADRLFRLGAFHNTLQRVRNEPSSAQILATRPCLEPNLNALLQLPEGTVGRVYAQHMTRLNLDPHFFPKKAIQDDVSFVIMRLRQTHDLWHVITGFNTDVLGEISLQAFMFAYLALPLPFILLGVALLRVVLTRPAQTGDVARAITGGIVLGSRVRNLFGLDWNQEWTTRLVELRARLNLTPESPLPIHTQSHPTFGSVPTVMEGNADSRI